MKHTHRDAVMKDRWLKGPPNTSSAEFEYSAYA